MNGPGVFLFCYACRVTRPRRGNKAADERLTKQKGPRPHT
jgi:hypothetical protein